MGDDTQQRNSYRQADEQFLPLDKNQVRRSRNLQLIPAARFRKGGKNAYSEWAYVAGIFQTLLVTHGYRGELVDIGCGTGLLALACEPLLGDSGRYTGIDVVENDIAFCRQHYSPDRFRFLHHEAANPFYAPGAEAERQRWPLPDAAADFITALSVWTHFAEPDCRFYFADLARLLAPAGKALVSVFLLDEHYDRSWLNWSADPGRYHTMAQNRWVFDRPAYGSGICSTPAWADVPEQAIGISAAGLDEMLAGAGLTVLQHYPGSWKDQPGLYFQDVLLLGHA